MGNKMCEDWKSIVSKISKIRTLSNDLVSSELEKKGIKGIVPAHGSVLFMFFESKYPLQVTTIAEKIGRAKSTVTGMIHTLEKEGYLEKTTCSIDKRNVYIGLTEKGERIRESFYETSKTLLERFYSGFSDDEKEVLVGLLNRIDINLRDEVK
jgi:MarR family transcriptional regulator, organic hydroperoxide resistance regulator